jgi:hypothetical protein
VKCEVELQMWHVKQDTTFPECTHARAWLAHGACKFYRWERSYRFLRQLPLRLVRVLLVWYMLKYIWTNIYIYNHIHTYIYKAYLVSTYRTRFWPAPQAHVAASEHRPQSGVSARPVAAPVASMVNNYARMPKGSRRTEGGTEYPTDRCVLGRFGPILGLGGAGGWWGETNNVQVQ